jgi:hypothetical protein
MRASRRFLPSSIPALEDRAVPSQMAPHVGALAAEFQPAGLSSAGIAQLQSFFSAKLHLRPVHLSSAQIAQSNASEQAFPLSVSATIHDGLPVAEEVTTTYSGGSTQTESLLKVPNPTTNTVTTYESINLRNNGGTEKIVDTESFSGGTTPFSGDDNTHTLTITLPNGSTESESYREIITGPKTVVTGTIDEAAGGVETWMSVKLKRGPKTTTDKVITEPDGSIEYQQTISTRRGSLDSTAVGATHSADSIEFSSSATDTIRVQPPSS